MDLKHLRKLIQTAQNLAQKAANDTQKTLDLMAGEPQAGAEMLQINDTLAPLFDSPQQQGSLEGQLLVASPLIQGGLFHKSVIYVFAHSTEGAMGCILNQPIEMVHFSALLEQVNIPGTEAMRHIPVHFGGPLERGRGFVLHTDDATGAYESIASHSGVAVTAVTRVLRDIAEGNGPEKAMLMIGYAGWGPGQLEREMEENSWITVPATPDLIFDTANAHLWSLASQQLGIADMAFYSQTVGHA